MGTGLSPAETATINRTQPNAKHVTIPCHQASPEGGDQSVGVTMVSGTLAQVRNDARTPKIAISPIQVSGVDNHFETRTGESWLLKVERTSGRLSVISPQIPAGRPKKLPKSAAL